MDKWISKYLSLPRPVTILIEVALFVLFMLGVGWLCNNLSPQPGAAPTLLPTPQG